MGLGDDDDDKEGYKTNRGFGLSHNIQFKKPIRASSQIDIGSVALYTPARHGTDPLDELAQLDYESITSTIKVPKRTLVRSHARVASSKSMDFTNLICKPRIGFFEDFENMAHRETYQQACVLEGLGKGADFVDSSLTGFLTFDDSIEMIVNMLEYLKTAPSYVQVRDNELVYLIFRYYSTNLSSRQK